MLRERWDAVYQHSGRGRRHTVVNESIGPRVQWSSPFFNPIPVHLDLLTFPTVSAESLSV